MSTPPATARGAAPDSMRSAAIASAAAPELQAMTTVSRGPPSPSRRPITSACEQGSTAARPAPAAGSPWPRARAQYHASVSSMPPPTAPTTSAVRASSARESPASSTASAAAASPKRSARERRRDAARRSTAAAGTTAAMRARKPSVSISVRGSIAQRAEASPSQKAFTPAPKGLTAPRPVTTTRVTRAPSAR